MDDSDSNDLEKEANEKYNESMKLEKELKQLDAKIQNFMEEIKKKNEEIQQLQKEIGQTNLLKTNEVMHSNHAKETTMKTLDEQIQKLFNKIQEQCKADLFSKYKVEYIERLLSHQKELKITYIIIKKLDIKAEFYSQFNIVEETNLYGNLKSLSRIGKLNYGSLKDCGPYLLFRLTDASKFGEIKKRSCAIWNLKQETYSLYDDTFNNMEVSKDCIIQEYFSFYQPSDSTLPSGHAVFYLIVKLKQQHGLLNVQEKAVNKVESVGDGQAHGANNIGNDLENCIDKLRNGEILKGLNKYHSEPYDYNKEFMKVVMMPENNIIFVVLSLLLVCISIYAIQEKYHKIKKWNQMTQLNSAFFDKLYSIPGTEKKYGWFTEYNTFDRFLIFIKLILEKDENYLANLKLYGKIMLRFFATKERDCFSKSDSELQINKLFLQMTEHKCYYSDYEGDNKDTSTLTLGQNSPYSFEYHDDIDITHTYNTFNGKFDKTGNLVLFDFDKDVEITEKLKNTFDELFENPFPPQVQAIEFVANTYEPNLDIFVSNAVLMQKTISGKTAITYFESVPFVTNMYENKSDLFGIDIARIIITIILLLTMFYHIYQKYSSMKVKSIKKLLVIIMNTVTQIKNLLLIFSTSFLIKAFVNYHQYNLDTQDYYDNLASKKYIDFYGFACRQRTARYLDQIAFYLIFIYCLKYLQFFEKINILIKSYKKSSFEFALICLTMLLLMLGMSTTTHFVYGGYIKEYSTFYYSFISNIKILLFIEDTGLITKLNEHFKAFSICLLIFYILTIRFFFMNLFYPIMIEYLRIEEDKLNAAKLNNAKKLTIKEKLKIFLCSMRKKKNNQVKNINKENDQFKVDELLGRQ